jgi:hypothetical protein
MTYVQICALLDHHTDLYNNPKNMVHKEIARQGLEHYKRLYQAYNN